jgi:hypothetical protein
LQVDRQADSSLLQPLLSQSGVSPKQPQHMSCARQQLRGRRAQSEGSERGKRQTWRERAVCAAGRGGARRRRRQGGGARQRVRACAKRTTAASRQRQRQRGAAAAVS